MNNPTFLKFCISFLVFIGRSAKIEKLERKFHVDEAKQLPRPQSPSPDSYIRGDENPTTMLLASPVDVHQSNERALAFLNAKFPTFDSTTSLSQTAAELLDQHNDLQHEVTTSDAKC